MRVFVGLVVAVAGFMLGTAMAGGHCPQEDSCVPDYQHHWYGSGWTGVPDNH